MTIPASRKVVARLALAMAPISGLQVFTDRGDDDPLEENERPGAVVRLTDIQFSIAPGGGQTLNVATVQVGFQSGCEIAAIDATNQDMIAATVALIGADRTLGGMVQSIEEQSASPSDPLSAAVGEAILEFEILYFTPRGDLTTIVGAGGAHF